MYHLLFSYSLRCQTDFSPLFFTKNVEHIEQHLLESSQMNGQHFLGHADTKDILRSLHIQDDISQIAHASFNVEPIINDFFYFPSVVGLLSFIFANVILNLRAEITSDSISIRTLTSLVARLINYKCTELYPQ